MSRSQPFFRCRFSHHAAYSAGICNTGLVLARDAKTQITLQLYNAARLSPGLLSRAEHEADWIFAQAGIAVRWQSCRFRQESVGTEDCLDATDPYLFVLWINPDHGYAPVSAEALGFALPFTDDARHGAVSYRNVEETFEQNRDFVDLYRLLANVMVHELTHLIFESDEHSTDLMRANWRRSDFARMSERQLTFTQEQIKHLHQSLGRRCQTELARNNASVSLSFTNHH